MNKPWYDKWESEYVGSGDERKNFDKWVEDGEAQQYIGDDNELSEDDLLNTYRDTQSWTDTFLDWAFVMEADERTEDYYENHYNNKENQQ